MLLVGLAAAAGLLLLLTACSAAAEERGLGGRALRARPCARGNRFARFVSRETTELRVRFKHTRYIKGWRLSVSRDSSRTRRQVYSDGDIHNTLHTYTLESLYSTASLETNFLKTTNLP